MPVNNSYADNLRASLDAQAAAADNSANMGAQQQPTAPQSLDSIAGQSQAVPQSGTLDAAAQPQQVRAVHTQTRQFKPTQPEQPSPPPKLQFNEEKLKNVKGVDTVFDAATDKSAKAYMDWYDKEVANINDTHAAIMAKMGQRPDPDRPLTRKEKFTALMHFGLNLIKASQPTQGGTRRLGSAMLMAGAQTVGDLDAMRDQEGQKFDANAAMATKNRNESMKLLGNRGDAMKGAAEMEMRGAQTLAEQAKLAKENNAAPKTMRTDQGIYEHRDGKWQLIKDNGKALTDSAAAHSVGALNNTYSLRRSNLVEVYKSSGLGQKEAELAATRFMESPKVRGKDPAEAKMNSYKLASTIIGGKQNFRGSDAEYTAAIEQTAKNKYDEWLDLQPSQGNGLPQQTTANDPDGIRGLIVK